MGGSNKSWPLFRGLRINDDRILGHRPDGLTVCNSAKFKPKPYVGSGIRVQDGISQLVLQ